MIDRFFGIHPAVIRDGFWAAMKPGEKDLYVYLLEESERYCTRELKRTDEEIHAVVRTPARTLCRARKHLAELGLVQCRHIDGNKVSYVICDPATRAPYPGDARRRVSYLKRAEEATPAESPANAGPLAIRAAVAVSPILTQTKPAPKATCPVEVRRAPVSDVSAPETVPTLRGEPGQRVERVCYNHGNSNVRYRRDGSPLCGTCHPPDPNAASTSRTSSGIAPKIPASSLPDSAMSKFGLKGIFSDSTGV